MDVLVAAERHRWSIEDALGTGKNEVGLNHNETRRWHRWYSRVCSATGP